MQAAATKAMTISANLAREALKVNVCGRMTALNRSVAKYASRKTENSTENLADIRRTVIINSEIGTSVVRNAPAIQVMESTAANANIYTLVDVVILRRYTAIMSRLPGSPSVLIRNAAVFGAWIDVVACISVNEILLLSLGQ